MSKFKEFKVISGGQTGIDQLALTLAKGYCLKTGGWMPPLFMTEDGPRPLFEDLYQMKVTFGGLWAKRTRYNVKSADATVLFGNMKSGGSFATLNFAIRYNKPYCINPDGQQLIDFVQEHQVMILNVAGNKASVLSADDKALAEKSLKILFEHIIMELING